MPYGYFDDAAREYVITNPATPVKWINYIGALAFGGFVDHTGGALICSRDPALNRITRYLAWTPASDFRGETLYVRVRKGGGYRVFSPFYVPMLQPCDRWECHVGLGYTRMIAEMYGVRVEVTIFVPQGAACELRDIRLTNLSARPIDVDLIPVVEYTHPDALKQLTNADWVPQTMVSRAVKDDDRTHGHILVQYPFMCRDTRINYFTSNYRTSSFETDRRRFLGNNEYGTWANPLALHRANLKNGEANRGDNIAALMHRLGYLMPGEERRVITQLGQAESLAAARPSIDYFCGEPEVDAAFADLAAFWDRYLSALQVRTPDPALDRMVNLHNPRQCYVTKQWSRYLSLYQLGYGERGIGFRDSSQDVMGVLASVPDEAKALLRQLLSVQRGNGSAMHQFNPLTMIASAGDALEREDRPHYYGDDHLWIVLAVCAYLKETGDLGFLDEVIPYYEKDRDGRPLESGAVLDHLHRALSFTHGDVGAHGLPLLGFADWNDTVNLAPGAESLFTANLYGFALREMIELGSVGRFVKSPPSGQGELPAGHGGDLSNRPTNWPDYLLWYDEMCARVNACGWDGEWYVRYFDHDGTPLGSRANAHGQIYANGQSWPVLSGFATPERGRAALDSLHARLNTAHGIKLSAPGFDGFDPRHGGITTYPPGAKENGGIFLHANPWAIIASTLLGDGDRAYRYYCQINPALQNERIDEYECEPYVYPQNILGDEHPQFGLARNSWLTGAASWAYQAATQYILGIRPVFAGLQIDPCIPAAWDGFAVTRVFRGATYRIEVANPDHVCRGVRSLVIDGAPASGNVVPPFAAGGVHVVQVVLGPDRPL